MKFFHHIQYVHYACVYFYTPVQGIYVYAEKECT